jgi:O-antigen/teichoic acid export membrane protein
MNFFSKTPVVSKVLHHELFRNTFIYSFGAIFLNGIGFFLLPIYTSVLNPEDYGKLALINTFSNFFGMLIALGLGNVAFIEYYHLDSQRRKEMINTLISIYLCVGIPISILAISVIVIFPESIKEIGLDPIFIIIAIATSFLLFFQSLYFSILKISKNVIKLTIVQVSLGVLAAVLNIFFVYYKQVGIIGILITNLIIAIVLLPIAGKDYLKRVKRFSFTSSISKYSNYLKIGLPFIPASLSYLIFTQSDRWLILHFLDSAEVGIYSVAAKFGILMQFVLITPIGNAYSPYMMKKFSTGDFNQRLKYIYLIISFIFLLIAFGLPKIAKYVIDVSYHDALPLIPIIIIGYGISLAGGITGIRFFYRKKVKYILYFSIISAIGNIIFNIILIPKYGIIGAAVSTVIGYSIGLGVRLILLYRDNQIYGIKLWF